MPTDVISPSDGTASNKPYSVKGKPSVGRRYYFDKTGTKRWRQFTSHQQACEALPTVDDRRGHEPLVINTGGVVLPSGYIEGGTNEEYWWKDDYSNEGLILKTSSSGGEGDSFSYVEAVNGELTI